MLATLILAAAVSSHPMQPGPAIRQFGPDRDRQQITYCHVEATRGNDMAPIHLTYISRTGICGTLPPGFKPYVKGERSGLNQHPSPAGSGSTP